MDDKITDSFTVYRNADGVNTSMVRQVNEDELKLLMQEAGMLNISCYDAGGSLDKFKRFYEIVERNVINNIYPSKNTTAN